MVKKASESFPREMFRTLTMEDVYKILRAAHVARVRFDYGMQVNTDEAAHSMRRALEDLGSAFDGTLDKHAVVPHNRSHNR